LVELVALIGSHLRPHCVEIGGFGPFSPLGGPVGCMVSLGGSVGCGFGWDCYCGLLGRQPRPGVPCVSYLESV
jgi:hypothetical protein